MPKLLFFYIPCKDETETLHLSKSLLDKKLVACTNSMPIKSCYFWNGDIEEGTEYVLIAKTLPERLKEVTRFLEKKHLYDIPCIASWKINVNESYFEWAKSQL